MKHSHQPAPIRSGTATGLLVCILSAAVAPLVLSAGARGAEGKKAADKPMPIAVAEVKHNGPVSFDKEILPILTRNCLACHNATKNENKLVLESAQRIVK